MRNRYTVPLAAFLTCFAVLLATPTPVDAGCSKRVVLYDASWCPYCREVRAFLARNNIRYTTLDATDPRVQADMIERFGDTAVPRTLVGRRVVHGADTARIKQLCR